MVLLRLLVHGLFVHQGTQEIRGRKKKEKMSTSLGLWSFGLGSSASMLLSRFLNKSQLMIYGMRCFIDGWYLSRHQTKNCPDKGPSSYSGMDSLILIVLPLICLVAEEKPTSQPNWNKYVVATTIQLDPSLTINFLLYLVKPKYRKRISFFT